MTHDKIIAVVQAHKDGKTVEVRRYGFNLPWDLMINTIWNFQDFEYRVKREPREWWLDFKHASSVEVYSHNHCGDCVLVREVLE